MAKVKKFPSKAEQLGWRANFIRNATQNLIGNISCIGRNLCEAKEFLAHGEWGPWLKREFNWTERTARNYMRVYSAFKTETVSDLKIDLKALYLLSQSKTPEPVRKAAVEMARTQHVTHAAVTEMLKRPTPPYKWPSPGELIEIRARELPGWCDLWAGKMDWGMEFLLGKMAEGEKVCQKEYPEIEFTADHLAEAIERHETASSRFRSLYEQLQAINARMGKNERRLAVVSASAGN